MGEVYKAIAAVQGELAHTGISKSRKNQQQGYAFRGIDDVYAALSPLLSKHKLCVIPRVLEREVVERPSQRGGVLFNVTVKAEFDFVSAEDGTSHTVCTFGEAMDSADKATNKAMSAAYKYAAFMTFAIPTEGDNDADANTPEPAARPTTRHDVAPSQSNVAPMQRKQPEKLKGPIKTRAELRTACGEFVRDIHACDDLDQFEALIASKQALIDQVKDEHKFYWEGDGADFLGLDKEIQRMRAELQQVNEHNERWRNDARAAG